MNTDYVFPNNNEQEFIDIAIKLDYNKLIFIYNYGEDIKKIKNKLSKLKNNKIKIDFGLLTINKNIQKAKKLSKNIIVKATKDNRNAIEKNKDILLYNLEDTGKKDFIHHRSSGLNQVLAKLMQKNNITLAFSFNLILNSNLKSKILGRIKQNIKLANKYKINTLIASFANNPYEMRSQKDLISFLKL